MKYGVLKVWPIARPFQCEGCSYGSKYDNLREPWHKNLSHIFVALQNVYQRQIK